MAAKQSLEVDSSRRSSMNARQYGLHHAPLARFALIAVLCATLLASALGQPAPAIAQVPASFAVVKDFGTTRYPGSSLFTGGALSFPGATVAGSNAYFLGYTPDSG